MTPKEVSQQLRLVAEKYKNEVTSTFNIRISDMAEDAADAIDSLQAFVDHIALLPTCNTCDATGCEHRPAWGDTVRYNCPLYKCSKAEILTERDLALIDSLWKKEGEEACLTDATSVKD